MPNEARLDITVQYGAGTIPSPEPTHARLSVFEGDQLIFRGRSEPASLAELSSAEVPHGRELTARVEMLDGPWLNSRALYAGDSSPFDFQPGDEVQRTITLSAISPESTPARALDTSNFVAERTPFGRIGLETPQGTRILGGPGSAPSDATEVVVYSGADVAAERILVRAEVAPDGSIDTQYQLPLGQEAERPHLAFLNAEGALTDTSSAPGLQAAPVTRFVFTANLLGKVLGSDLPNPNALVLSRRATFARSPDPANLLDVDASQLAGAQGEAARATAKAGRSWRRWAASLPPPRSRTQLAYDGEAGHLVLFGGMNADQRLGDTWRWTDLGWREVFGDGPPPRENASFHHLPAAGGLVLYGGDDEDGSRSDLWVLRDGLWSRLRTRPDEGPGPLTRAAVALDPRANRLLMFGGCVVRGVSPEVGRGACDQLSDGLWAFDGRSWSPVTASNAPSARQDAVMVYDPSEHRMLLVGGKAGDAGLLADRLWSLDLESFVWTQLSMEGPPRFERGEVLAWWNAPRERLEVHLSNFVTRFEIWAFEGGAWTQAAPNAPVPAAWAWHPGVGEAVGVSGLRPANLGSRALQTWNGERLRVIARDPEEPAGDFTRATYDPVRNLTYALVPTPFEPDLPAELWVYDGATWRRLSVEGLDHEGFDSGMVVDPATGDLLLIGGVTLSFENGEAVGGAPLGDTWRFDGSTWSRLTTTSRCPNGPCQPALPFGSTRAVYDPTEDRILVLDFGRLSVLEPAPDGGWTYTALAEAPALNNEEDPTARILAYDEAQERLIYFMLAKDRFSDDVEAFTWAYDGEAGVWRELNRTEPRYLAAMAYDASRGGVVRHGGSEDLAPEDGVVSNTNRIRDEAFELIDNTWVPLRLETPPPPRFGHAGAPAPQGGLVFIGGFGNLGSATSLQSTFLLQGPNAELDPLRDTPGTRCHAASGFVPSSEAITLTGGSSVPFDGTATPSTWSFAGYGWRREPSVPGFGVANAGSFVDPGRSELFVLGGTDRGSNSAAVWSWNGARWQREPNLIAGLSGSSAAWDPAREGALLAFAGLPNLLFAWTRQDNLSVVNGDATTRSALYSPALLYEPNRGVHVLTGAGLDADETCVGPPASWRCAPHPPELGSRRFHEGAVDELRGRILISGGAERTEFRPDTWEWYGSGWRYVAAAPHDTAHTLDYLPERRALLAHGGIEGSICRDQTHLLDLDPDLNPEIRMVVDFAVLRESAELIEGLTLSGQAGGRGYALDPLGVGAATEGFVVEAWHPPTASWREAGRGRAGLDSSERFEAPLPSTGAEYVTFDGKIELRVRPVAGEGSGIQPSEVRASHLELEITYVLR